MDSNLLTIEREVLRWPDVSRAQGRFGAVAFSYRKREIGHLHRVADLPVTTKFREGLLARGRARPHRAGVKGYVSYPVEDQEDVSVVLEILGRNYARAKEAAERVAASREEDEASARLPRRRSSTSGASPWAGWRP